MHFEINVPPGDARLAALVKKIGGGTPPAASGWPTVQQGASGFRVTTIQHLLRARGQSLTVDGSFGAVTTGKVKAFQASAGLVADGVVGPKTWAALVVEVRRGSSGQAVVALQKALTARGQTLTADGVFGSGTEAKVRAFQQANGLVVDGVVGPKTWAAIV